MNVSINKIFKVSLIVFIILIVYTIPTIKKDNVLRTSIEIKDISKNQSSIIYLLNNNNLLVEDKIYLKSKNKKDQVKEIINYLKENTNNNNLKGYIPNNIKITSLTINNNIITITFSNTLSTNNLSQAITGVLYSLLELDNISEVNIKNNGNLYNSKKITINNEYKYKTVKDITKVVTYYLDRKNNTYYFVPITKYINAKEEPVKILINELKEPSNDLISTLDDKLKLLSFYDEGDIIHLNFNSYLIDENSEITNLNKQLIAKSIFKNFDINMVIFEVNGQEVGNIIK